MKSVLIASLILAASFGMARAAEPSALVAPQPLSACVWSNLPQQVRSGFLKAYARGGPTGAAPKVLEAAHEQAKSQMVLCARRSDIPSFWVAVSLGSRAIQEGALAALAPSNIDRPRLFSAWKAAPEAARACTAANAAKVFSLQGPPCSSPTAVLDLMTLIGIDKPKAKPKEFAQAAVFYNALAQEMWVEQLIAMMPPAP